VLHAGADVEAAQVECGHRRSIGHLR
jgi:hypothetical protein